VGTSQGLSLPSVGVSLVIVAFAIIFGVLSYARTSACRRQTGRNPWGIPPKGWLLFGVLFGIFGAAAAMIASSTTRARPAKPAPGPPPAWAPGGAYGGNGGSGQPVLDPVPEPPLALPAAPLGGPPPGWYPDPAGVHQHRWWTGSGWADQVVDEGFGRSEPLPPYPGP
jgi:uncharacterized membrane protein YsdA (DUF1294 family)